VAVSKRARAARGATLTVIAFVNGILLLALGSAYMATSEKAYTFVALRAREAQLYAAADAGLLRGLDQVARDRATPLDMDIDAGNGVRVSVKTAGGAAGTELHVSARWGTRQDRLERHLVATVGFTVGDPRPRIVAIHRE
jgi:hypothetical protein